MDGLRCGFPRDRDGSALDWQDRRARGNQKRPARIEQNRFEYRSGAHIAFRASACDNQIRCHPENRDKAPFVSSFDAPLSGELLASSSGPIHQRYSLAGTKILEQTLRLLFARAEVFFQLLDQASDERRA